MRFLIFLLLSIHLCCNAYGQETLGFSCEEFPNLPEISLDAFEKKAAELNDEENLNNTLLTNMRFIASVVWECSENAHQFNTIIEHALDVYFRHPRIRTYIFEFLDTLSFQYDEIKAYNEENTPPSRWATHTFRTVGIPSAAYGIYEMIKWTAERTIGNRFKFISLSRRQILAALGIGAAVAAVPAIYAESNEEDITIKIDPSIVRETPFCL